MNSLDIRDKLFKDGYNSNGHYASVYRFKGNLNEIGLLYIIEGYRKSTDLLINALTEPKEDDLLIIDSLIFPLLFNFRHYIEIIIKDTIRYHKLYNNEISIDEVGFDKEHSLMKLWDILSLYLKNQYSEEKDNSLEIVGNLLRELDTVDKASYAFRYPFNNKKGNNDIVYSTLPMTIDLNNLKLIVVKLQDFFEGINWHIAAMLDE